MKNKENRGLWQVFGASAGLLLIGVAEIVLWLLCGYAQLLLLAVLQLLGALVALVLLLPAGKHREMKLADPEVKQTWWKKLLRGIGNFFRKLGNFLHKRHSAILALALFVVILAGNVLFWSRVGVTGADARLQYYVPVAVAVLFALSVVLEKWCSIICTLEDCSKKAVAIARNLKDALIIGRIAQVATLIALVLKLIGLFDAGLILTIVLAAALVFYTVMLLLSAIIRIIRKELTTEPLLPMSPKAAGSANIIAYLEENTGITMRSLWSIRLVRQLLPGVLMLVVILTWLSTGLIQIESHQEAAVYRLGKLREQTLKPGLHMTLPWPFDRVEVVDTQSVRRVVVGYVPNGSEDNTWTDGHGVEEYRLLSGGGNEMVSINLQVEYRINDLNRFLRNATAAESLLSASAYEIITARTIATDMDALLSSDRVVFSETFREELVERITCYNSGIEVTNVVLESIHPPVEVADVYQQVITAGIHAKQLILETERAAIAEVTVAQQKAYADTSIASTTYFQSVAAAKGAVQAFMASVEANQTYPEAYTFYKYSTAMTEAFKKGVVIIVGEGVDSGKLVIGDLSRPVMDEYGLEDEVEEEYYE